MLIITGKNSSLKLVHNVSSKHSSWMENFYKERKLWKFQNSVFIRMNISIFCQFEDFPAFQQWKEKLIGEPVSYYLPLFLLFALFLWFGDLSKLMPKHTLACMFVSHFINLKNFKHSY